MTKNRNTMEMTPFMGKKAALSRLRSPAETREWSYPSSRPTTPTPAAALSSYVSEVTGIGLIVVVVIAAGAFTFDSHQGLATFLRTRVTSLWQLITPRFTASAAAAAAVGATLCLR